MATLTKRQQQARDDMYLAPLVKQPGMGGWVSKSGMVYTNRTVQALVDAKFAFICRSPVGKEEAIDTHNGR